MAENEFFKNRLKAKFFKFHGKLKHDAFNFFYEITSYRLEIALNSCFFALGKI